ncbi:amidohydrolase [Roseomonas sp. OT10]|uniref:amidohydrolase n=1 Tax=Roseomonas cutis TaxID=2897332 RepID=UPI001E4E4B06|nr:amidohydrolase [Roseomonas sp. OT10]UFN50015.1 amidohydrolase [Roseomonas sp. OT10]
MSTEWLLAGGRVFRGLSGGFAEALLVRDGRVAAVGTAAEVEAAAGPEARRIDLAGRVAIPAFNEAHMHLLPYGLGLRQVNLRPDDGVKTLDALLGRIAAAAKETPKGEWVIGRGYDHGILDVGRHPTADELSRVAPEHPVYIVRTCGHLGVGNRAALALAGIGHNTPDPEGGAIGRRNGELTGLLAEQAQRLIRDVVPEPGEDAMVAAIEAGARHLASLGFAAASDMNVGMTAGLKEVAAYHRAVAEGRLPLRMWQVLAGNPEGIANAAWDEGMRPGDWMAVGDRAPRKAAEQDGTKPEILTWGAVKVFGDGSAGGLTAAMFEPYREEAGGGTGLFCFPDATMHALLLQYHKQGWQLDIHAIGDAAIEQVLSGMEAADSPEHGIDGRRHRIEHCGFLNRDQRRRMLAHGILPVPQPTFIYEFGDVYIRNLGYERSAASYPMRTWLAEGHHPSASSDAPVCTPDPFVNLYTMVTRKTVKGTEIGPEEAITVEQAVHCYTWCGAFSQFAENRRGTLEPGMLGDVAVLSRDIFDGPPEALLETRCDLTLRGGAVIFDRNGEGGGG